MVEKIKSYMEKYHMIEKDDCIVTGVSGGADSVCLLLVLKELQKEMDFTIRVVHIEHGIRGEESKQDAGFVRQLCEQLEIPFMQASFDVLGMAKTRGLSVEETGRNLRYQVFETEAGKEANGKIAVAHNQNDNAETVLHHMIRGSGLQGLSGIAPVRENIIRPLLCVERAEIEAYLSERNQLYCTDETNFDTVYTRNRIRGEVMPVLLEINGGAVCHMSKAAEIMRETWEYMKGQIDIAESQAVVYQAESVILKTDGCKELPKQLVHMLIHQSIGKYAGSSRDISKTHIKAVAELFDRQTGKQVSLPYGLTAVRIYEGVRIKKGGGKSVEAEAVPLFENREFTCRILEMSALKKEIPKKKYTKWLDYDKIEDNLCVRGRQPGDFFYLQENGGIKRLKQYFVDEKIPQEMRKQIPLVAEGPHIIWIVGYRISAYYKVGQDTRRILEIQYSGGREDE